MRQFRIRFSIRWIMAAIAALAILLAFAADRFASSPRRMHSLLTANAYGEWKLAFLEKAKKFRLCPAEHNYHESVTLRCATCEKTWRTVGGVYSDGGGPNRVPVTSQDETVRILLRIAAACERAEKKWRAAAWRPWETGDVLTPEEHRFLHVDGPSPFWDGDSL